MLNGIDVSAHQPSNVIDLVPADFAIIKATGGTGYVNPRAAVQMSYAPERNGLYHFAGDGYPWTTPEAEAQNFLAQWSKLAEVNTIPVLDWEPPAPVHDVAWAERWLDIVAGATGKTPLLYCNLSVATSYDWSRVQALGVKLWLAWYGNDQRIDGYQPTRNEDDIALSVLESSARGAWRVAIWQYSQNGYLPGYGGNLDLNIAYEDLWANGTLVPGIGELRP